MLFLFKRLIFSIMSTSTLDIQIVVVESKFLDIRAIKFTCHFGYGLLITLQFVLYNIIHEFLLPNLHKSESGIVINTHHIATHYSVVRYIKIITLPLYINRKSNRKPKIYSNLALYLKMFKYSLFTNKYENNHNKILY